MKKPQPQISVVIFTKNEEENIKDCIKSAKPLASEIIVIDMQSKDKTRDIAKSLGTKIYEVEDHNWVEPVRNFGLSKANYEWILVLDADERVPKTLTQKLLNIVSENQYDVVKIPRKTIFFKKWIQHTAWWPDYNIRFFKKGFVNWVVKIHPEVIAKGQVLNLKPKEEYALIHENARNIKIWLQKIDHHTDYEDFFLTKENLTPEDILKRYNHEFYWRYFEHQGYKDGLHGFVLSKFMEFYRFLEFAKVWEKKGFKDIVNPEKLKAAVEKDLGYKGDRLKKLQEENDSLTRQLEDIKSSRTFKVWQKYLSLKNKIKKLKK